MAVVFEPAYKELALKVAERQPIDPVDTKMGATFQSPGGAVKPDGGSIFYQGLLRKAVSLDDRDLPIDTSDPAGRAFHRDRMIFRYAPQIYLRDRAATGQTTLIDSVIENRRTFMEKRNTVNVVTVKPYYLDRQSVRSLIHHGQAINPRVEDRFLSNAERREKIRSSVMLTSEKLDTTRGISRRSYGGTKPRSRRPDWNPTSVRSSQRTKDRPMSKAQAQASDFRGFGRFISSVRSAVTTDIGKIKFPPLRFPVWRRKSKSDFTRNEAAGGILDRKIPRGTYVFTFDIPHINALPPFAITKPFTFMVGGKQQVFRQGVINPKTGVAKIMVEVTENFIIMLSLVTAALAAAGFAGMQLNDSLKQVDRVIVDTTKGSMKLATAAAVGLGAWFFFPVIAKKVT